MGYTRHHAIIVTSFDKELLESTLGKAILIFGPITSGVVQSKVNGFYSFFIGPDGSNEGWDDSRNYDYKRATFIKLIKEHKNEDGGNKLKFVELFYGDSNNESDILNHN